MNLFSYLSRRSLYAVAVLLGLSVMIFLIARVMPGDPARVALGPRVSEEVVQRLRDKMHLNDPLPTQYYFWIKDALRGEFGDSLYTRRPVAEDIRQFFPATLELAIFSWLIVAAIGIFLGIVAAQSESRWRSFGLELMKKRIFMVIDLAIRFISYLGVVTPAFVFAILFLLLFGFLLDLFPTIGRLSSGVEPPPNITGLITVDALITGNFAVLFDALWHLFLPAISLAMGGLAQVARITRSSIMDNLNKDYIEAGRSYGIPERLIMLKYLLKPSLIPTVAILGLEFAVLLSNAFVVELVYNWPGISRYGIQTMLRKDLNAISAVILIIGITFVTANLLVDILVGYLDPRIRKGTEGGR